jgi:hypothetical protein
VPPHKPRGVGLECAKFQHLGGTPQAIGGGCPVNDLSILAGEEPSCFFDRCILFELFVLDGDALPVQVNFVSRLTAGLASGVFRWAVRAALMRMMRRRQDCTFVVLVFDAFQLGGQVVKLKVRYGRPLAAFARDDARIFERVAEQSDHTHKRRIERKVDARLSNRGPVEGRSFGCNHRFFGTEIAAENGQGFGAGGSARHDERIVIARNCEDGRGVVAERIVKLIVIEPRLAEIVDYVAEMKKKCRTVGGIGRVGVGRKLIGYVDFAAVLP